MDINFDIKCDCIISIGSTCKTAFALVRNNLRFFSSPFDWMLEYSLEDIIHFLSNGTEDFFKTIEIAPEYSKDIHYGIIDTKYKIISMHDFIVDKPLEESYIEFKEKMNRRFAKLNLILKKARTICFICNRDSEYQELFDFATKIDKLYKFKKILIINMINSDIEKIEIHKNKKIDIYEVFFEDINENGPEEDKNPDFWKGDVAFWDKFLSHVHVRPKFFKKATRGFFYNLTHLFD